MEKDKLKRILEGLIEQSEKKTLYWEQTANANTFLTSLQGSAATITYKNLAGLQFIVLEFRDENGEVFVSETLRKYDELWNKATEAYNLARNIALKTDEKNAKIDNILRQLEGGKTAAK